MVCSCFFKIFFLFYYITLENLKNNHEFMLVIPVYLLHPFKIFLFLLITLALKDLKNNHELPMLVFPISSSIHCVAIRKFNNDILRPCCTLPETTIRELAFRTIFQIVSALDGHPITPGIVIIARSRYTIAQK